MTKSWISSPNLNKSLSLTFLNSLSRSQSLSLTLYFQTQQKNRKYIKSSSHLKNSQEFSSKRQSNQNVKAKRGSSSGVYVEVNWAWFGGVSGQQLHTWTTSKGIGFLSWNSFFKSTFLRTFLKLLKTKVVPLCMS